MNWKLLYDRLDTVRKVKQVSWRGLGLELGLCPSTFTRLSKGLGVNGLNLVKIGSIVNTHHRDIIHAHGKTRKA